MIPEAEDILKTLVELLEAQEGIKIKYKIGDVNERDKTIQPPKESAKAYS